MKTLVLTLFVFSAFAPALFAQTTGQTETVIRSCVEIIRGTQRQCENAISPGAVQMGEKVLSGREGGKAQAKRVTPEHRKDSGTKPSNQVISLSS